MTDRNRASVRMSRPVLGLGRDQIGERPVEQITRLAADRFRDAAADVGQRPISLGFPEPPFSAVLEFLNQQFGARRLWRAIRAGRNCRPSAAFCRCSPRETPCPKTHVGQSCLNTVNLTIFLTRFLMSDETQIGAVINEMYAMISGPAGPRDWSRQGELFPARCTAGPNLGRRSGKSAEAEHEPRRISGEHDAVLRRQFFLRSRDRPPDRSVRQYRARVERLRGAAIA